MKNYYTDTVLWKCGRGLFYFQMIIDDEDESDADADEGTMAKLEDSEEALGDGPLPGCEWRVGGDNWLWLRV